MVGVEEEGGEKEEGRGEWVEGERKERDKHYTFVCKVLSHYRCGSAYSLAMNKERGIKSSMSLVHLPARNTNSLVTGNHSLHSYTATCT